MARFSLEIGLRRSNVNDQAKARKAIAVPLSDTAITVLREQLVKKRNAEYIGSVFVYQGKPVYQTATAAWRKALKRAGIRDLRWHDLRHTWASWHIQRGTPLQVLKELGGWETMKMVQRYAHLSADHLAQWATPLTVVSTPRLAAMQKRAEREKPLKPLSGLARPAGIEPATPAFGGQYSIH
ncbi:hypothetical protein DFQ28_003277 [Apophysomyces sp. BC1034]|nr:hypothetical protein DFQ28_003277 [Apophysomyces sp. BC1034]